jgi:hypothetical protein
MRSDYARLFKVLDGYAKNHHECFLAELDLHEETDEYVVCFRPIRTSVDSVSRYACRYLRMEISEAREIIRAGMLPVSVANLLDEQLPPLSVGDEARCQILQIDRYT